MQTAASFLRTGDTLKLSRIFTSEDVLEYSKVSHDSNPLHFDSESARNAGFEDRLVHGMLVAALFPKIISSHFPGAIYVSQSLHFRLPVYIGEEIVGESEIQGQHASRMVLSSLTVRQWPSYLHQLWNKRILRHDRKP
ncbi:Thioesterase superfamily protein, partial [Prunus dulcis]